MTNLTPIAIAIDGPVASGKTTVGRIVARRLGFRFLDTGLMYRAVTWVALQRDIGLEDGDALAAMAEGLTMDLVPGAGDDRLLADGEDVTERLRDPKVDAGVSFVSRVSGVRTVLVKGQREMAERDDFVMVGRDIGTVVLPNAGLKVYLGASVELRARRRHHEIAKEAGEALPYEQVLADLTRRDRIDSERADSPLRAAPDAISVETDDLDIAGVVERILGMVE